MYNILQGIANIWKYVNAKAKLTVTKKQKTETTLAKKFQFFRRWKS